MPELPEVEVVRAGLAPAVTGATVTAVEVLEPRSLRRHAPGAHTFAGSLRGSRMLAPLRRGKFTWIPLGEDRALVAHLGMSGQLLLRDAGSPRERHERVRMSLESASGRELDVLFVDQRIFGSLAIEPLVATADGLEAAPGMATLPASVTHIARDPLDVHFDPAAVTRRMRSRASTVKRALLDQTLVSGIGNIYADEALWEARVHPEQPTATLSGRAATRVLAAAAAVMERALVEGGTSFDAQYVNVNGQAGTNSLNVYGREGLPCKRCDTPIVRERFMNRSSHLCPRCQRRR